MYLLQSVTHNFEPDIFDALPFCHALVPLEIVFSHS